MIGGVINPMSKDESEELMKQATESADDLYNIRDTYFPSNPNDKITKLQTHSQIALNLLDSIPSVVMIVKTTTLVAITFIKLLPETRYVKSRVEELEIYLGIERVWILRMKLGLQNASVAELAVMEG
ncbi:hypothetical protein Tco_1076141 [Tanacetum coccineum]